MKMCCLSLQLHDNHANKTFAWLSQGQTSQCFVIL